MTRQELHRIFSEALVEGTATQHQLGQMQASIFLFRKMKSHTRPFIRVRSDLSHVVPGKKHDVGQAHRRARRLLKKAEGADA